MDSEKLSIKDKNNIQIASLIGSKTRYLILKTLKQYNKPLSISELSLFIKKSSATISQHVKLLEQSKLIEIEYKSIEGKAGVTKEVTLLLDKVVINLTDD